ncbi:MAG: hypothetical protein ABSG41_23445 [Bryobacteraceae bacterium]|jgi:phage antirepressor YoqD-like protein
MASSLGTKLGPKKQEAIEALLRPGSVEDVAREINVATKKLSLWMKDPEFMAAYRAAKRAECRQSMAYLGQGATQILKSMLYIMYHSKKPALRLRVAREITLLANEANEIEEFVAGVADAERMIRATRSRCRSTGAGLKARPPGHGAKRPRREEQAIVALLAHRSVAEAARTLDIKPQTLRLWMQDPAFNAKYAEAACAVYGPAMSLAQQHHGDAVVIIKNLSVDPAVPEETRFQAAIYRAGALRANVIAHLESRLSGMEPGSTTGEPQVVSQAIDSSLHERLQQIKSRLQQASGQRAIRRMILVHSADGRAAGSSVAGPDGRHRWWDPPEGYKKDDLVKDDSREGDKSPVPAA